jgi:hypothetical protein
MAVFFVSVHICTNLELKDTKERFVKIITGAKGKNAFFYDGLVCYILIVFPLEISNH